VDEVTKDDSSSFFSSSSLIGLTSILGGLDFPSSCLMSLVFFRRDTSEATDVQRSTTEQETSRNISRWTFESKVAKELYRDVSDMSGGGGGEDFGLGLWAFTREYVASNILSAKAI